MVFNFQRPFFLLLIPIILLFIIWCMYQKSMGSSFQKRVILGIRSIVIVLLILGLGGMQLRQYVDQTTTIFAVDLSHSTQGAQEQIREVLQRAMGYKTSQDHIGIVSFGENAVVEAAPAEALSFTNFYSIVRGEFTNIAEGLKLSSTLIPETTRKRIVLISDGQENVGTALQQSRLLAEQGIRIDGFLLNQTIAEEVQVSEIILPKYLHKNVQFDVEVKVDSLVDTEARIKLYRGKLLVGERAVVVRRGENRFVFSDEAIQGGGHIYKAEIEPEIDTLYQNNVGHGYTYVEDVPRILVVEDGQSGEEIKKILQGAQLHIGSTAPQNVPLELDVLSQYDGIILANVSAEDLDDRFMSQLELYVKTVGGGVIVTGGENAYALGGYFQTPLETILPVDMELKGKTDIPDLGMLIIVDRSGSMTGSPYGISKMELAKEAAIRAVDALHPFDQIGIIAFDDQPIWSVPLQKVEGNEKGIKDSIANISPGGGTSILPALEEGYQKLTKANTKLKHVILLTDGIAERTGYEPLIAAMKESGITLSTVAVGGDSDTRLMENLAEWGNGRYYYSDEFTDLPKIFTKETFLAGKTYINQRTFYPKVRHLSPILQGIEQLGSLDGYIGTTAKERAEVILGSDTDEPILAAWQYGVGRTVAWTSDMHQQWTVNWLQTEEAARLFRNMVSWAIRKQGAASVEIAGVVKGKDVEIIAKLPYEEDVIGISGVVIGPNLEEYEVTLNPSAPGIYKGVFQSSEQGAFIINLQIDKYGQNGIQVYTGINIPYSAEYDLRHFSSGEFLMQKITAQTGGVLLSDPKEVFAEPLERVYGDKDLTKLLLIAAMVCFLLDIGTRRIPVILEKIESIMRNLKEGFKKVERSQQKSNRKAVQVEKKPVELQKTKKEPKNMPNPTDKKNTSSLLVSQKQKRTGR